MKKNKKLHQDIKNSKKHIQTEEQEMEVQSKLSFHELKLMHHFIDAVQSAGRMYEFLGKSVSFDDKKNGKAMTELFSLMVLIAALEEIVELKLLIKGE